VKLAFLLSTPTLRAASFEYCTALRSLAACLAAARASFLASRSCCLTVRVAPSPVAISTSPSSSSSSSELATSSSPSSATTSSSEACAEGTAEVFDALKVVWTFRANSPSSVARAKQSRS
jgi:hypothetical protein